MASSLMASQTLIFQNPVFLSPQNLRTLSFPSSLNHHRSLFSRLSKPRIIFLRSAATPKISPIVASSSSPVSPVVTQKPDSTRSVLTGSTRTVTTLAAIVLAASRVLVVKVVNLGVQWNLQQPLAHSVGPAFFAAAGLNTPFTVIAAGMAKWLDIYSGVLMVRVLLSWFPNIPWDKQPLSAIRDLCDPYLNLFRNLIPPIFNTLDVSPLLAFAVLGTLASILNSSRG